MVVRKVNSPQPKLISAKVDKLKLLSVFIGEKLKTQNSHKNFKF